MCKPKETMMIVSKSGHGVGRVGRGVGRSGVCGHGGLASLATILLPRDERHELLSNQFPLASNDGGNSPRMIGQTCAGTVNLNLIRSVSLSTYTCKEHIPHVLAMLLLLHTCLCPGLRV